MIRRPLKSLVGCLLVMAGLTLTGVVHAARFPAAAPDVFFQTSGPLASPTKGDWYTSSATASSDRRHRFLIEVTAEQLAACGGSCQLKVRDLDADRQAGTVIDEIRGGAQDPIRVTLLDRDGIATIGSFTHGDNDDTTNPRGPVDASFQLDRIGVFQLTVEVGALPIFGDDNSCLNDDDNAFYIEMQNASGLGGGLLLYSQASVQQNGAVSRNDMHFLIGPAHRDSQLALRNFDVDGGYNRITYYRPSEASLSGTVSGDGVWNGHGSLDAGADFVLANNAPASAAADSGTWRIVHDNWTVINQLIFEVQEDGARIGLADDKPLRAGNFTISGDAPTLCAAVDELSEQPISVTNHFLTRDIINLSIDPPPPGWSAMLVDSSGAPLVDSDGDGNVDTGILMPGQSIDVGLRTMPDGAASQTYDASINASSYMDQRVDPQHNIVRTLERTARVCPGFAKTFQPSSIGVNGVSTLSITIDNPRETDLTGLSFTDVLPDEPGSLVLASPINVRNDCGGSLTDGDGGALASGGHILAFSGGRVVAGGRCTIRVDVTAGVAGQYLNRIEAGGFTTDQGVSNLHPVTAEIDVNASSISVVKSSAAFSDPFNGRNYPKRIPGGVVTYQLLVSQGGSAPADPSSFQLIDAIPANTDLLVADVDGAGSGPVLFLDGYPSSGGDTARIEYSRNGGASFDYTPVADANQVDPAVTHFRVVLPHAFECAVRPGAPSPNFSVSFRVRVK